MTSYIEDETLLFWHNHIESRKESNLSVKEYCKENKLSTFDFANYKARLKFHEISTPEHYAKMLAISEQYTSEKPPIARFVESHNISRQMLLRFNTHLKYKARLERLLQSSDEKPMKFIQVPSVQPRPPAGYRGEEAEVLEKQNDIEIIISKGVKVSISPNIDSMKIIKIIELLKDL